MTDRVINQLIALDLIDREEEDIYRFGLEVLALKILHYTSYLLIAVLLHEIPRFLILFAAFSLLRKSAGGFHAKTKGGCYIGSCAIVLVLMMCAKELSGLAAGQVLGGCLFIMTAGDIVVWKTAPLGNRSRTFDEEENKVFRHRTRMLLLFENIFVLVLMAAGLEIYAIPIALAIGCEAVLLMLEKLRKSKIGFLMLAFFLFWTAGIDSRAQEASEEQTSSIVFLLDCSQSMQDVDGGYASLEFIKEFTASAPYHCKIGVVAYNNEVVASLPTGSSYEEITDGLSQLDYRLYGNAGVGMKEAVKILREEEGGKKIILISDGEIVMKVQEQTVESATLYEQEIAKAAEAGIEIDVLALGSRIEEGETVYQAARTTGGTCYELENGQALQEFIDEYMLQELKLPGRITGKINGTGGELKIKLPDCQMKKVKIILTGRQENDNMTVNCEAKNIDILKGDHFTVVELQEPHSEEIAIKMLSETDMEITAYFAAYYEFFASAASTYLADLQQAQIRIEIENAQGSNLLDGHLANGGIKLLLNGEECPWKIENEAVVIQKDTAQSEEIELEILFQDDFSIYSGDKVLKERIEVLPIEEPKPQTDWFFWGIILVFVIMLTVIFLLALKRKERPRGGKIIDESRIYPGESNPKSNDFYGKIMIYVIHNKEDIDYPPESINLFARCNRDVISLEWLLDECNLPLNLKGAEKIIIRPGEDRSLAIKNNSKAAALKGRELLERGRFYHLYYHEKVTFIFDQEDAEIEVHYKDLKPNER